MSLPPLHEGHIYIRRKSSGKVLIIPVHLFNPEVHEKVTSEEQKIEKKLPATIPAGLLDTKQPSLSRYTKEQLLLLGAKQIKNLPEFTSIKDQFFKSKEELIERCLALQSPKKETVVVVEETPQVSLSEPIVPVELPKE